MIDRRKTFRIGLSKEYIYLYDGLCALLDDRWQPYSGIRTVEEQNALYDKHDGITNAQGLESAHCHGCATDWTIFDSKGHPTWLDKKDRLWDEYTTAIWKVGSLRSGKDFPSVDIDHNELAIDCKWKDYKVS